MKYPMNQYMQGKLPTCMFSSLACAIHDCPCPEVAQQVYQAGVKNQGAPSLVNILLKTMESFYPKWEIQKMDANFDILRNRSGFLTMAILMGSDGSVHHSVSVKDNYLYDSTCPRAMLLRKEILDWCVSEKNDEGHKVTFLKCDVAYRFIWPRPKKIKCRHYERITWERTRRPGKKRRITPTEKRTCHR